MNKRDKVILAGDLYAKIGDNTAGNENIIGVHGLGVRINNGETLLTGLTYVNNNLDKLVKMYSGENLWHKKTTCIK